MSGTIILTPDKLQLRPGKEGNVKGLFTHRLHEGNPHVTCIESPANHYAQVHSHSEDEIMVVVKGRMFFNGEWCGVGSIIYVPANEEYWYSTGDEACRIALVRPNGKGTFRNGLQAEAGPSEKPAKAQPEPAGGDAAR
jgi:quercetin dioxygenase-like cupin family protein